MNTNIFLPILIKIYPNIYSSKVIQIGFVFHLQGDNVFSLQYSAISCLVCKQDHKHGKLQMKPTRNILYNLNINTRYPNIIIMLKRCTQTVTKQLKRKYFYNLRNQYLKYF